nr:uncharacterized protein LOC121469601 [Taeniopygia guttata]
MARIVSAIYSQWGIGCKLKDFHLAMARLLELGAIERPVDVLHPEIWDKCTAALAEDTKSSGSGRYLKAWGKTVPESDSLGSGDPGGLSATPAPPDQSPPPPAGTPRDTPAAENPQKPPPAQTPRETANSSEPPPPPARDPIPETQEHAERFWQRLLKEARAAETAVWEDGVATPPPYPFENGAGSEGEGRGSGGPGANTRGGERDLGNARAREKGAEGGAGHRTDRQLQSSNSSSSSEELTEASDGSDSDETEPARLETKPAIDSSTLPTEARGPVVADCLRQQCNSVTKDILRSLPAGASLADMIRHVVREEHLTPIQAAIHTLTSAMACFKCGSNQLHTPASEYHGTACGAFVPTATASSACATGSAGGASEQEQTAQSYPKPCGPDTGHPVWVEQWPLSKPRMTALLELVDRELQKGHIEPSTSPWNTPVFVIPKRSGEGYRLVHDLREVNKTIQPMGPVQTLLPANSAIPEGQPCAVLDIKDCFFSIPLHAEDKERFAFSVVFPNGERPNLRFQWKVLPQGLVDSPTICQITVDRALMPVRHSHPAATIIQYMDDILVAAPSASQVDHLVSTITETLQANGFEIANTKIKRGPCVTFLGVGITNSYVTPPKIKVRRDIKTLHDMQRLVGSLQWLRNIILVPPEVMDPLYDLLKGKHPWDHKELTPQATKSLDFIERQMSTSLLARWNPGVPLDLYVHFTQKGGVGALAQGPSEKSQPIQWVVLGRPTHAFSPGVECIANLITKGRRLALRHLGTEPARIHLPFRKRPTTESTAISEHLALALTGFGGEISYATKPPWTQLLTIVDIDVPPKVMDRPQRKYLPHALPIAMTLQFVRGLGFIDLKDFLQYTHLFIFNEVA